MKIKTQTIALSIISWVVALLVAVSWLFSSYPYVGVFWVLLWSWVQFRIWQDRQNYEKIVKELQPYLMAHLTAENTFVPDLTGNLIPIFPKETEIAIDCQGCKYFYGRQNIVCAVHPSGYDGESCGDRCSG